MAKKGGPVQDLIDEHCGGSKKKGAKKKGDKCANKNPGATGSAAGCKKLDCSEAKNRNDKKCHDKFCCYDKNKTHADCKVPSTDIVIKISCRGYPDEEIPYPKVECHNKKARWKVSIKDRDDIAPSTLRSLFSKYISKNTLTTMDKTRLEVSLSPPGMEAYTLPYLPNGKLDGKLIAKRVKNINEVLYPNGTGEDMMNMHHLRPVWAGGKDKGENLWPATPGHQIRRKIGDLKKLSNRQISRSTISIHDWWSNKLLKAFNSQLKRPQKGFLCRTKPKAIKTYSETNVTRISKRFWTKKVPVFIEIACRPYCTQRKKGAPDKGSRNHDSVYEPKTH